MKFERILVIAAAIALALYGRFLYRNLSYCAGGPDSGGYMNEAKLIASGHVTAPVPLVRELGLDDSWLGYFMPLGFAPSPHARMHPLYPPGLPMHVAAFAKIGGWKKAPYLVAPLAAIGCVILMILIARRLGVPLLLSYAGAIAVAWLPPFLWHAVQPASDVLAMFWALVAVLFALSGGQAPPPVLHNQVLAGVAFSIGLWVRPTNALMVIPLAMIVRFRWRSLVAMAVGALPLVVALMFWNAALYGSPQRTGYGAIQMTWAGAVTAGPQHAIWLFRFLTPVIFPIGLFVVFDRAVDTWTRSALFVWFTVFYVFYAFYGFWDGFLCVRFLLPAIPAVIFGAELLMRDAIAFARGSVRIAAIAVVALLCVWIMAMPVYYGFALNLTPLLKTVESGYPQYMKFSQRYVPKDAVVVTGVLSGAYLLYENRSIIRYDQLNDERFQILRAYAGVRGLPWYAVVSDEELDLDVLRKRFRADWERVDAFAGFTIYRIRS